MLICPFQSEEDLIRLAGINGVTSIYPVTLHPGPNPVNQHVLAGPDDPNIPEDTQSTHIMCGVDKLHAEGRFGAGVKIGIIDSGFDYKHPSLGGCFGPGCKFASGYDFVGDYYGDGSAPKPDKDPLDQCAGHGTHVAGIIGANPDNEYTIRGVAYGASLYSYRFGLSPHILSIFLTSCTEYFPVMARQMTTLSSMRCCEDTKMEWMLSP